MGSIVPSEDEWAPESVLSGMAYPPVPSSTSPVPFFHLMERLKTTKREGWQQASIKDGESIADHMYRMSIIVMLCPPSLASQVDVSRCVQMALVHDMAECLVGDITPLHKGISKTEKARREAATMAYITQLLPPTMRVGGTTLMTLFQEYEENTSLEAQLVHDIDKVEMVMQTFEYERCHERDLSEFYHVVGGIRLDEMREWAMTIMKEREVLREAASKGPNLQGNGVAS
ncbi:hypothetical protein FE257_010366 [Aspergillus nanangensis]|uniref:5'-deoxynucleotidase n=1 Tax=Aspergillus nanangensis TaxID=2582783 RepID=A0AAD4CK47_ASPNN|nr:hypothetical protein FE257_010366 [Aspergillus nanangensis]